MEKQVKFIRDAILGSLVKKTIKTAFAFGLLTNFCNICIAGGPQNVQQYPQQQANYSPQLLQKQIVQTPNVPSKVMPQPRSNRHNYQQTHNIPLAQHHKALGNVNQPYYQVALHPWCHPGVRQKYGDTKKSLLQANVQNHESLLTIIDEYLTFTDQNDLYVDIVKLWSILDKYPNKQKLNVTAVAKRLVDAHDRIMYHALYDPVGSRWCDLERGNLGILAQKGLQSLLHSRYPDDQILNIFESFVRECFTRDQQRHLGIDNRLHTLLSLDANPSSATLQTGKFSERYQGRTDIFFGINNEDTYRMMHRVMKTARELDPTVSPFSLATSCHSEHDAIINTLLDTFKVMNGKEFRLNSNCAPLYMLLLAVKDTDTFGFRSDVVKTLLTIADQNVGTINKNLPLSTVKYRVILQELVCELLKKQASCKNVPSNTLSKIDHGIRALQSSNQKYISYCIRSQDNTTDNHKALIHLLQELNSVLLKHSDAQQEEVIILNDIILRKQLAERQNHHHIRQPQPVNGNKHKLIQGTHSSRDVSHVHDTNAKQDKHDSKANVRHIENKLKNFRINHKDGAEVLERQYNAVLDHLLLANTNDQQSVHIQDVHTLSCYTMLSEAFKEAGAGKLLKYMRSDSSAAVREIYEFFKKRHFLDGGDTKLAFSLLVNNLNNSNVKIDGGDTVISNELEYNNKIYNLTEMLNFTINYIVYGVGLDVVSEILASNIQENLAESGGCLPGFINRFFTLIASDAVENVANQKISTIRHLAETINSCLKRKHVIKHGKPKQYSMCHNYIFQVKDGGKGDRRDVVKAINFLDALISYNQRSFGLNATLSQLPNSGVLSKVINFAVTGNAVPNFLLTFMFHTLSGAREELAQIKNNLTGETARSKVTNSNTTSNTNNSNLNAASLELINGYKRSLNNFEFNKNKISSLYKNTDDLALLLTAIMVRDKTEKNLNIKGKLQEFEDILSSTSNLDDLFEVYALSTLYDSLPSNQQSANALVSLIKNIRGNSKILSLFTDMISVKKNVGNNTKRDNDQQTKPKQFAHRARWGKRDEAIWIASHPEQAVGMVAFSDSDDDDDDDDDSGPHPIVD